MSGRKRLMALGGTVAAIVVIIVVIQATVSPPASNPAASPFAGFIPPPTAVPADGASVPVGRARLGPQAPDFTGITRWLNSPPLSLDDLDGRVVLVDFWTYTCVNCIRTLPYLRDWQAKYASNGLVIVGVHSPEFEFEKVEANVREAIVREAVTWPVAMDNDFGTWVAYQNRFWPHKFLIDRDGSVRYHHIGEGAYLETEREIRDLLTEAGYDVSAIPLGGVDVEARPQARITREMFAGAGWALGDYLGNAGASPADRPTSYADAGVRQDGQFYLRGEWESDSEGVRHARATEGFEDYVALEYRAASVNIVVRPEGDEPFRVLATLDGKPIPEGARGDDISVGDDGTTYVRIDSPRMYNIVRERAVSAHELELRVNSTDFVLYTFTFGP